MNLPLYESTSYIKHSDTISSFYLKLFSEKKLVKSVKILMFNINLINSIQKYPNIIESHACSLQVFEVIPLLPINF